MIGAIAGDICGSIYEWDNIKTKEFPLFGTGCHFTDDTVMTAAIAKACIEFEKQHDFMLFEKNVVKNMRFLGRAHINAGYGGKFKQWLLSENPKPYGSIGNGSAMRVSPVIYTGNTLEECLLLAEISASVTHNHLEGIKGAQAVASAGFLARNGAEKAKILEYIGKHFYNINFTLDEIRDTYSSDITCPGSVPQALEAFLEAEDFVDAIRNAISIGGDSDTIACIAGSIAECFFDVPNDIKSRVYDILSGTDILQICEEFQKTFDLT